MFYGCVHLGVLASLLVLSLCVLVLSSCASFLVLYILMMLSWCCVLVGVVVYLLPWLFVGWCCLFCVCVFALVVSLFKT